MLSDITPVILTYNEQENIERTLTALQWAQKILVIDSFSTDNTVDICQQFENVEVIANEFKDPAQQCNFGLSQNISTTWVLSIDADYVMTAELKDELENLVPDEKTNGYSIEFNYLIDGQRLTGSLYPSRVSLYRLESAHYVMDGHTQRVVIKGQPNSLESLKNKLDHDDRKPFKRWIASQKKYANQEASKLRKASFSKLKLQDKLRWLGIAPLIILPYTLFYKKLILDGKAGWEYAKQRLIAEWYLQLARFNLLK